MPQADQSTSAIERMLAIKAMAVFADVDPDETRGGRRVRACARLPPRRDAVRGDGSTRVVHPPRARRPRHRVPRRPALRHPRTARCPRGRGCAGTHILRRRRGRGRGHAHAGDRARPAPRPAGGQLRILSATLQGVAAATLRLRRRIVPSAGWPEPPPIVGRSESLTDDLGARVAFLWRVRGCTGPASGLSGSWPAPPMRWSCGRASVCGRRRRCGGRPHRGRRSCAVRDRRRPAAFRRRAWRDPRAGRGAGGGDTLVRRGRARARRGPPRHAGGPHRRPGGRSRFRSRAAGGVRHVGERAAGLLASALNGGQA